MQRSFTLQTVNWQLSTPPYPKPCTLVFVYSITRREKREKFWMGMEQKEWEGITGNRLQAFLKASRIS